MYKFLATLLLIVAVATASSKEKQVIIRECQNKSGHNDKPSNPPDVFYDDSGEITIVSDTLNVGSLITVKNENGDIELEAVTYSSNSTFLIPITDESASLKFSIITPNGMTYEGLIINNQY